MMDLLTNEDGSNSYQLEYTKDNYDDSYYLQITFEDIAGNISKPLAMGISKNLIIIHLIMDMLILDMVM